MNKQYTFILSLFIAIFFTSNPLFSQIQTQIDNANIGDVVVVSEGTYNEALVIDKSITLQADGVVILNVAGFVTGINIQSDIANVTVDGFTITGDSSTGSGIVVSPGANDITLTNNTIQSILLPGGGNASPLSYGILCYGDTDPVNPPSNILIDNNSISNVLGSAISLGSDTENVLISNNTFSDIIPVDLVGDGELTSYASIGIQAELSNGLGIESNTYNGLTISNNLIDCNEVAYVQNNTYINSNLMLSTSFPHSIPFGDTPWWSTTWSDGVNNYEAYYNDPTDMGYLYWVSLGIFTQNSLIPGCQDDTACNFNPDANDDDGSCEYADANADCNGDCLEGYTELTLMWSGAVADTMTTSFSVSGSANGELYSATLDADSGSMTECWMTDLQADCFSIEIEGPDGLEWSIYSPLSDDPFLTGTNESMVFGSQCLEIWGCTDLEACNYNELATDDDGSCVVPTFENNIQCDECCMYSVGAWTHVNAFYLASSDTPTLSAFAENWELSSAAFLYSEETINEDGSVSTTSWFGADSDNSSMLTGDCYNGQITLVLIFKTIDNNIVGDIVIKMFDDGDMYFETITSVDSFDLTTATMTGTIEAGNSGTLIMVDSDGNGVGDCDESTSIQEGSVSDRKLIKKINLLGQEVEISNKRGVSLYIYDDGTVEKKNQLR